MIKYFKHTVIILSGIFIFASLISCTPGKSQLKNAQGMDDVKKEEALDKEFQEINYSGENNVRSGMNNQKNESNSYSFRESEDRNLKEYRTSDYENREKFSNSSNGDRNRSHGREKYYQTGKASWYGREFDGKVTASGERFDMNDLTAAHRSLPFGTVLEVRNFSNNKTIRVRINDRGPYRGNRIIDLSFLAARKLGMIRSGVTNVGIILMGRRDNQIVEDRNRGYSRKKNSYIEPVVRDNYNDYEDAKLNEDYILQAGAFYSRKNAEDLKRKIEAIIKNPVILIHDRDLHKVQIKGIVSKSEAGKFKRILAEDNIESFVINR